MTQAKNQLTKSKNSKICNAFVFVFTIVSAMSIFAVNAFATDLGVKLKSIFQQCYGDVSTVFDVAAILALGVCLLTLLFGRGSKSAEKSYDWLKTIVICFVVFHFLGTLVPWLSGLFDSSGVGVSLSSITG